MTVAPRHLDPRGRRLAVLALAFLTFSIPFLLHVRQCRYYSLAILGSIWCLYFLFGLIDGRRGAMIGFVAAASVGGAWLAWRLHKACD